MASKLSRLILAGLLGWALAVMPAAAATAPNLDLKEALRLAWKANPGMQVSRLQALIAGEEVVRARSGFLPTVKSEVSQTIYDNEVQAKIPSGAIPGFGAGRVHHLPHNQPQLLEQQDLPRSDHFRLLGHPLPLPGRGPGQVGQPPGHGQDPG